MVGIAEAVRDIINQRPFLEDALARQIINYNSLAQELQHSIEDRLEKSVKITSISMALRRLADKYREEYDKPIHEKLSDFVGSDMEIKYDLIEITIDVNSVANLSKFMSQIYTNLQYNAKDFLSITKSTSEITIITGKRHRKKILELCQPPIIITNENHDLAALSIQIPPDSIVTPGLFYLFTKVLTFEGINIAELVSTFSEMQFILDEEDVGKASTLIRRLLKNTTPFQ